MTATEPEIESPRERTAPADLKTYIDRQEHILPCNTAMNDYHCLYQAQNRLFRRSV